MSRSSTETKLPTPPAGLTKPLEDINCSNVRAEPAPERRRISIDDVCNQATTPPNSSQKSEAMSKANGHSSGDSGNDNDKWPSPPETPSFRAILNEKDVEPSEVYRTKFNSSFESLAFKNKDPAVVEYEGASLDIANQPLFGPEIVEKDEGVAKRKADKIADEDILPSHNLVKKTTSETHETPAARRPKLVPVSRRPVSRSIGTSKVASWYNIDRELWANREVDSFTALARMGVVSAAGIRLSPVEGKSAVGPVRRSDPNEAVAATSRPQRRRANNATQSEVGAQPQTRSTPMQRAASSSTESSSASVSGTARRPKKRVKHEDTHYTDLPDVCPPVSTLGDNPNALKAVWGNKKINLEDDPDRDALHPSEIEVARVLRLSCNTYMCCKRRIFLSFVERTREGMPFRKTQAQQACILDVNKASKLHTAFENVGWFDLNSPHWKEFFAADGIVAPDAGASE